MLTLQTTVNGIRGEEEFIRYQTVELIGVHYLLVVNISIAIKMKIKGNSFVANYNTI